jgi:hypothetical protein
VPGDRDFARWRRHHGRRDNCAKGYDCNEQEFLKRSHENLPSGNAVAQLERFTEWSAGCDLRFGRQPADT